MQINRDDLLKTSEKSILKMVDLLENKSAITLNSLPSKRTALIIVDMINGFVYEGALASPRIQSIIPNVSNLLEACQKQNIPSIAFADNHAIDCIEFDSFPPHCTNDSHESEMIEELKSIGGYTLIHKNSTNGFLEEAFQEWLMNHSEIDHFIVVGDCTDLCVEQFCITLKTYFNKINKKSRIIVPTSSVETYDFDVHAGDFMQVLALYKMLLNGIDITSEIVL